MIANLPKWYRLALIDSITAETLEKRSTSINNIVKSKDLSWLLDCIRLYLQKPIKNREFSNEFFLSFKEEDSMFLNDGTDLEKRILAGAIIAESIAKSAENIKIATTLKSAIFGIEKSSIINIDIVQTAIDFLNETSEKVRDVNYISNQLPKYPVLKDEPQTADTLTTFIKSLNTYIKEAVVILKDQNNKLQDKISSLEEESNVHWWLFRSYSGILNKPISALTIVEAPIILGIELSTLVTILPPPANVKAFLQRNFSNIEDYETNRLTIKEEIQQMYNNLRKEIGDKSSEQYGNLTPLFFGYEKAIEAEGNVAWTSIFESTSGLRADESYSAIELALQFFIESTLLKL